MARNGRDAAAFEVEERKVEAKLLESFNYRER